VSGNTLTCNAGSWTGSPTFAFQWLRDGVAITGASGQTYTLTAADVGRQISCRVTGANSGGSDQAPSNAVTPSAAPNSTPPPTTPPPTTPPPSERCRERERQSS